MPHTAPNANRMAITMVSVAMLGLAMVLGLWQQVDQACTDGQTDLTDPIADCNSVPVAEVRQVPSDPEVTTVEAGVSGD